MIYLIERINENLPFDGSTSECQVGTKIYDVVPSPKNTALEMISDHVIDDNQLGMVFTKTNPRETKLVENFVEERFGPMSELLFG